MKYSQPKHFWDWFKRNSQTLSDIHKMDKKEKDYWLKELFTHMKAYTRKLYFEIYWNPGGVSGFVVTAYGNEKYFRMAEKLVEKAPEIPGWQIVALLPPGLYNNLLDIEYANKGIDIYGLRFLPPKERAYNGKYILNVYTEVYTGITDEMNSAVNAVLSNWLGEKTYALEIDYFTLDSTMSLTLDEKQALVPIDQLPSYVVSRDTSSVFIDANGQLISKG